MALEQTINAEAKSRLKGIIQFADISTAVNRWIVTGSMRSQITNRLLEMADLKGFNSDSKELNQSRIARDKKDVEKLKENICATTNPFSENVCKVALFKLRTGKQASITTENFLQNVLDDGVNRRDLFIKQCQEDQSRFEKPIIKVKVINFSTENFHKKNKSTAAEVIAQTKGTRDVFGRLLFLSVKHRLDIKSVFAYPLLTEPVCFAHPDGSVRDSPKSKMYHFLKSGVKSTAPEVVDNIIIDGMFLVRTLLVKSTTYQSLARNILVSALKMTSHRADLCFDVYESSSIKDIERKERGNVESCRLFSIRPKQKIEGNVKELLKSSNIKNELLRFLFNEFQSEQYAPLIAEKVVYCAINNTCFKLCTVEEKLKIEDIPSLYGNHLEADTRVMLHAKHADDETAGNIVVRANDADICVILIANAHHLEKSHLWYDAGQDHDNTREYIDITTLQHNMSYTRALPGAYGFLDNDYSPAFFGKGKVKPLQLIISNEKFKVAFSALGEGKLTHSIITDRGIRLLDVSLQKTN